MKKDNDGPDNGEPTVKEKKTTAKPKAAQQFIYVGPNLPGGRLTKFSVFKGGIPVYLDDLIEKHPQITDLIVPVASAVTAQTNSAQAGTAEYESYQTLTELRG